MDLKRILEALLFVADTPLGIPRLAGLVDTGDRAAIRQALVELMGEYQERDGSFEVVEVAGGYSFRTKPEYAQWIQKLGRQQVSRLSPAALETLAAIAYKQPVLRAEVERIRGVDVGGVLRMLMEKSLIQVVGRQDLPGKPLIYGTTKHFLEVFGLNSIKDLPTIEEMEALMGDMADDGGSGGEVTQIGDGRLPLTPSRRDRPGDGAQYRTEDETEQEDGPEGDEEDLPEDDGYLSAECGADDEPGPDDEQGRERPEPMVSPMAPPAEPPDGPLPRPGAEPEPEAAAVGSDHAVEEVAPEPVVSLDASMIDSRPEEPGPDTPENLPTASGEGEPDAADGQGPDDNDDSGKPGPERVSVGMSIDGAEDDGAEKLRDEASRDGKN